MVAPKGGDMLIMLLLPALLQAGAKKELADGKVFHHSRIGACQTDKDCAEEGKSKCRSKLARVRFCAEQYSGTWTTTCVCEAAK